jgi:hypothetical protein
MWHYTSDICSGRDLLNLVGPDFAFPVTHQDNTLTFMRGTGTLNADGSFVVFLNSGVGVTFRGVFANEEGRTVIRDGDETDGQICHRTFVATKQ